MLASGKSAFSRPLAGKPYGAGFGGAYGTSRGGSATFYASGSVSEAPGGGEFSTMEKRRDESRRGRHECLRHSLARVAFDFFTPSYASGSV